MARELTGREKRYIQEAKRQAPNKGDVFGVRKVGDALGISHVEAEDIVRILEREFGEVGYVKRVAGNPSDGLGMGVRAVLTDRGREFPIQLAEDEKAARRARSWRRATFVTNGAWALLVLLGMPFYENYIERRMERDEREQQQRTVTHPPALPPPTTRP